MIDKSKLKGIYTALITPFDGGKIDKKSLARNVEMQMESGISGLVVCGSTGEASSLTVIEQAQVIEVCKSVTLSKIPIFAGCTSSSSALSLELAQMAVKHGAEGVMLAAPPYVKPSASGLKEHFKNVIKNIDAAIMIYDIASRTSCTMSEDFIEEMANFDNVVAIKNCDPDSAKSMRISINLEGKGINLAQFSGDDAFALPSYVQGSNGVVSVASNIVPHIMVEIYDLAMSGKYLQAIELNRKLFPLFDMLFCEPNPAPVKYAASILGNCKGSLRLPMTEISQDNKRKIKEILEGLNVFTNIDGVII